MKVVINGDYGGFSLRGKALERYSELKGLPTPKYLSEYDIARTDPILVQVVEEGGPDLGVLEVEDVEKGTVFRIDEYDGAETIVRLQDHDWMVAN